MKNSNLVFAACRNLGMFILCFSFHSGVHAQQHTEFMRAFLYVVPPHAVPVLLDGNLTDYDDIYSNDVDWDDAWKMTNFGENFGILRSNITLVIERRKRIPNTDTTYFRMWNMHVRNYMIEILTQNCNHTNLCAVLVDRYLNRSTPINLNGTTRVNFAVTINPASSAQNRFKLIYVTKVRTGLGITPHLMGNVADNKVKVEWETSDDITMGNYKVEHSADGSHFESGQMTAAVNGEDNTYSMTDEHPVPGENFYRIRYTDKEGNIQYTAVSKITVGFNNPGINIYPNPVTNKTVQLQLNKLPAGKYDIQLLYPDGTAEQLRSMLIKQEKDVQLLALPQQLASGIYYLKFTGPGNKVIVKAVTVL